MENHSSHRFIISCEHALNWIPDGYDHLFTGAEEILSSHRGWDPGALIIAHTISSMLQARLYIYPFTRLLIDPNRSEHHPNLFSSFTRDLPVEEKTRIMDQYYRPYRLSVEHKIGSLFEQELIPVHLSIHTFTPKLKESVRDFDIGLLYDPSRTAEKLFCSQWKKSLVQQSRDLKIRMNQPYKGKSDGFTTSLRRMFKMKYIGIELEVNQAYFFSGGELWDQLCKTISESLLHIQFSMK